MQVGLRGAPNATWWRSGHPPGHPSFTELLRDTACVYLRSTCRALIEERVYIYHTVSTEITVQVSLTVNKMEMMMTLGAKSGVPLFCKSQVTEGTNKRERAFAPVAPGSALLSNQRTPLPSHNFPSLRRSSTRSTDRQLYCGSFAVIRMCGTYSVPNALYVVF